MPSFRQSRATPAAPRLSYVIDELRFFFSLTLLRTVSAFPAFLFCVLFILGGIVDCCVVSLIVAAFILPLYCYLYEFTQCNLADPIFFR